jgi:glycosyltransferase involved in cell wall biosynthesis
VRGLRIALVGPLPPSTGGMANQTQQLGRLLREEGFEVAMVQVNSPYHPWFEKIKGLRAVTRLLPYLRHLWRVCGKVDLVHIMANSGWSWHLYAAPAIWIAHFRGTPVIVNYRGGEAGTFLDKSYAWIKPSLAKASMIIVPSGFLDEVFRKHGFDPKIVSNIIDFSRFYASNNPPDTDWTTAPKLLVARNLELIYDNATAIRAFKIVHDALPLARLSIAGTGPELAALTELVHSLQLETAVTFTGRIDNKDMPQLYRNADIMLNPTTVDNMPISILESLASGVAVVSTDVGGIPYIVQNEKTAMLVPPADPTAMAQAVLTLVRDPAKMATLIATGRESVEQYTWPHVREHLLAAYAYALPKGFESTSKPAGEQK